MKRFQQTIREPLFDQFEKLARERGIRVQDIVREACEEWFHWQKKAMISEEERQEGKRKN